MQHKKKKKKKKKIAFRCLVIHEDISQKPAEVETTRVVGDECASCRANLTLRREEL